MKNPLCAVLIVLLGLASSAANAALQEIEDNALSAVDGGGYGLVLDQYSLSVDAGSYWKVRVGGTTAELNFTEFSWYPEDGTATLGRVEDPIYFDVATSSGSILANGSSGNRTYLHLAMPQNTLATDLMSASYLMTLDHISTATGGSCTTATTCRYDTTRVTTSKMNVDKSYLRLWSEPLPRNNNQGAQAGTTTGLAYVGNLSLHADSALFVTNEHSATTPAVTYNINTTPGSYTAYTTSSGASSPLGNFRLGACPSAAYCDNDATMLARTGFDYVYEVGQAFYQPVTIHSMADGNFVMELDGIPNNATIYNDFYNRPTGHVSIGSLITDWDGVSPRPTNRFTQSSYGCGFLNLSTCYRYTETAPRRDFGYSRIEGIRLQYLKIETIGL